MARIAWNKGLTKADPRVAQYSSKNKTQFKKGLIPWNKDKKGVMPEPWNKGMPRSEETKQKIRETKARRKHLYKKLAGKLNPMWKADRNISYAQKHRQMKPYFENIKECQKCGSTNDLELSNISGKYLLEVADWQILCISCHKKYDNIVRNFKK